MHEAHGRARAADGQEPECSASTGAGQQIPFCSSPITDHPSPIEVLTPFRAAVRASPQLPAQHSSV
jgi:hypothetical protein